MNENRYDDTAKDLIINRMSRSIYDDLLSTGQIDMDQLYLIDDPNFDVFNKRIVNLNPPENAYDAVNLDYLSTDYLRKDDISKYVDNSKLYSLNAISQWPNGHTYICGDRKVYIKDTNRWNIVILQGSIQPSDVTVEWNSRFGWQFKIGEIYFGQNFTQYPDSLHDTTTYKDEITEVSATSWHYETTLLDKKEIYACLSGIDTTKYIENDIDEIQNRLNSILSAFTKLNAILSSN